MGATDGTDDVDGETQNREQLPFNYGLEDELMPDENSTDKNRPSNIAAAGFLLNKTENEGAISKGFNVSKCSLEASNLIKALNKERTARGLEKIKESCSLCTVATVKAG